MKVWMKAFLLILLLLSFFNLFDQDDQVTTTETVRVVNVEVPVRVFYKDRQVDHLTRGDFKIFEDGNPQEINGFYIRRKKIIDAGVATDTNKKKTTMSSRYFVLVFKISNYNDQLKKGLDYLFENFFRETDQCMVFINNITLFFKNLSDIENVRTVLNRALLQESHRARQRMLQYLKKIEDELNTSRLQALMRSRDYRTGDEIIRFLQKYLLLWGDYNRNYLQPNIDNFYYFSRHLEKIKKVKWVINFYQIEMFPKLRQTGNTMEEIRDLVGALQMSGRPEDTVSAQTILSLLHDIDLALHSSKDFPAEDISKLFYKVDATFHSVLIFVNRELLDQDLEYKRISTEIENSLREITKRTGGSLQATGNLESALGDIEEKEDITYMLTYSPDNPDKIGKLRVEVVNKKFKILYDDQMRADYIKAYLKKKKKEFPDIQILNTRFKNKILSMDVKDYLMAAQESDIKKGRVFIEIEILDSNNMSLYDQKKTIISDKSLFNLAVRFPWIQKGRYNIIVQVTDILTGKTTSDFLHPTIF